MPTKLTESEILRYRTTVYGMAATMGRVPRMSFGRDRYGMGAALSQVGHVMHMRNICVPPCVLGQLVGDIQVLGRQV